MRKRMRNPKITSKNTLKKCLKKRSNFCIKKSNEKKVQKNELKSSVFFEKLNLKICRYNQYKIKNAYFEKTN